MHKILFTGCTFRPSEIKGLLDDGFRIISADPNIKEKELIGQLKKVDAYIVGGKEIVNANVIKSAGKNLKLITQFGVGIGTIDLQAAKSCGIIVANTPKINSYTVAEFTVAMLMMLNKKLFQFNDEVRKGKWTPSEMYDLAGKTVGIVGMGHIGTITARLLQNGFKMKVLYNDIVFKLEADTEFNTQNVSLDKVLRESDIVSLHVPLDNVTKNMIGKAELAKMKKHALLINTARAEVVDAEALYQALQKDQIAGAAFDGFYTEPVDLKKPESKLLDLPSEKFILTPHTGYDAYEGITRMQNMTMDNIRLVLNNKVCKNAVV